MLSRSDGGRDMAQAQLLREPGEPGRRVLPLRRLGEGLAPSRLAPAPFEDVEASRLPPLDRDDPAAGGFKSLAEGTKVYEIEEGPNRPQARDVSVVTSV